MFDPGEFIDNLEGERVVIGSLSDDALAELAGRYAEIGDYSTANDIEEFAHWRILNTD